MFVQFLVYGFSMICEWIVGLLLMKVVLNWFMKLTVVYDLDFRTVCIDVIVGLVDGFV